MIKKILILVITFFLIATYFVTQNLTVNSVYYASNMPHDNDSNPELIFILKNLEMINKPELPYLKHDYDGANKIIVNNKYFIMIDESSPIIQFFRNSVENDIFHLIYLTKQGKFHYEEYSDIQTHSIIKSSSDSSKRKAIQLLDQAIQPIIDVQPEPDINLQWLFNLIYQRQFE